MVLGSDWSFGVFFSLSMFFVESLLAYFPFRLFLLRVIAGAINHSDTRLCAFDFYLAP